LLFRPLWIAGPYTAVLACDFSEPRRALQRLSRCRESGVPNPKPGN